MAVNKSYDNDSIQVLTEEQRIRRRPETVLGTKDINAVIHTMVEVVANAVDEADAGFGNYIAIDYNVDTNEIGVKDKGRGIPLEFNNKVGRYNWKLVFCEMYAGGKMDSSIYQSALGLNGLGVCATQYTSEYMDVEVYRDNKKFNLHFEKGKNVGGLKVTENVVHETGTYIKYKPDLEVFDDIKIQPEVIFDIARRNAMIHKGLQIDVIIKKNGKENTVSYLYNDGIVDYVDQLMIDLGGRLIKETIYAEDSMTGKDREDRPEYTVHMELAMNFSRKGDDSFIEFYHNSSSLTNGGVHLKAFKKAVTEAFSNLISKSANYSKESKIVYEDVKDLCKCVLSTKCPGDISSYENQTKKALMNPFVEKALVAFLTTSIESWGADNSADCEVVMHEIVNNKKARESAEAVKANTIRKLTASIDKVVNQPKKFKDCTSKDSNKRELFIVEGDSALTSCLQARNPETQAIMPLRGKIMNCLKENVVDVFKSEIITDLIKVIGCGVEVNDKKIKEAVPFNINKLRWSKIIICTDGDVDGYHIRCIVLAMLYKLIPTLLKEGYVYIAETPLYEINYGGKTGFVYTDKEKDAMIEKLHEMGASDSKIKISRSKGLGENEADMMNYTTMNPATRRLVQVLYDESDANTHFMFNALLGDDINNRKVLINDYSAQIWEEEGAEGINALSGAED